MARGHSPPRNNPPQPYYYDRVPESPLINWHHPGQLISGVPSLQSLRNPPRNQDAYDLNHHLVSPMMSRTPSVASDRHSIVSGLTANYFSTNPDNVNPPPAYVAPFGATQVVSEHRAAVKPSESDDERATPNQEEVHFSEPALALVNTFLDQLLFSFLSTARSTSLLALKPAVLEVLKHRLARDAIASAEDELKELLSGGDEEEELNTTQNAAENRRRWDLELVWKRTRLRVMVYMRLGEMEDDDEERYVKQEELFQGTERRFSQNSGLVSWAAAIFLTGVLEYVAEQTLQAAGNAAYSRDKRQHRSTQTTSSSDEQKTVIVEEHDVEKVALSPILGRLWRTWRKLLRGNSAPSTSHRSAIRMLSTESLGRPRSVDTGAEDSVNGNHARAIRLNDVPEMEYPEHVLASNIPLPLGDRRRDIDEIEVPGLAHDPDVEQTAYGEGTPTGRRNSFTGPLVYSQNGGLPTPDSTEPMEQSLFKKPALMRQRSSSVPTPARTPTVADMLKHAPGAFPEEGAGEDELAQAGAPNAVEERRDASEPKASATDMAAHKQEPHDVKGLLDKVVAHVPPEETPEQATQSANHGLLAGAVAGATAAAAVATSMVLGKEYDPYKLTDGTASVDDKALQLTKSAQAPEPVPSTVSNLQAEEWDTHKSLIDIKSLLSSGQVTKRSNARPQTPPKLGRNSSDESRSSYTLGDAGVAAIPRQSPARRQHMANGLAAEDRSVADGIGVASTFEGRAAATPSSSAEEVQARDVKKRPAKLHLPGTPQRTTFDSLSGVKTSESPKTARDFLESRSLPASTGRPEDNSLSQSASIAQARQPLPLKQPQKRRSISGVAFTSAAATPVVERNPHRQSWSAAVQQQRDFHDGHERPLSVPAVPSMPAAHKSSIMTTPIQEHPVVQRMASLKRHERKSETPVDGDHALTSASIRGPEDFDIFVQGAETVKYTLTPETVRERPAQTHDNMKPRSPVELSSAPSVSRRRLTNPKVDPGDGRTGRSVVSKQATSAIPAAGPATAAAAIGEEEERRAREDKRRSVSKPPPRNVSAHRKSGLMAREPRVVTDSTQDFADFIRSTGPSKAQEVKPVINPANMSTTSLHSLRSAHINGASSRASSVASEDRARSMTSASIQAENVPPVPPVPQKRRSSMQPRVGSSATNGNPELIDFIRSGPTEDGERRVSRAAAPLRSTMDSDQLQPMGDRFNNGRSQGLKLDTAVGPTQGPPSARSQRSNRQTPSRTSLRSSMVNGSVAQTVHPAHSGEPQRLAMNQTKSPAADLGGGRRQYRNKDPYAIDMEDDDQDLLTALPKNSRQEESLVDFLNNNEPPKDNAPRPLVTGGGAQARNTMNRGRVSSMNSLRSANAEANAKGRTAQSTSGPHSGAPGSARPGSGPGNRSSGPSASRPKLEARSPGEASRDKPAAGGFGSFSKEPSTKDLADFLKNSGPDDDKTAPAPNVGRHSKLSPKETAKAQKKIEKDSILTKGKRGFLGKAMRKKTWLDMP
ncbi:hypothetical protein B0A54_08429 [Friedmanniomyces endolithicus]|uniref:Uncharacterized protein n=1 Tax=Friedmanniomyces endolithicus TaxID=329885 RepID=A0A4U0UVY5_9PEZI|nr:hypothetical protein LTS09_012811 [Friedmanniomyces endolithicus]TKA39792.1 hypothetical protein B0A54_08429 [Friedmanniomyces endolithicus]